MCEWGRLVPHNTERHNNQTQLAGGLRVAVRTSLIKVIGLAQIAFVRPPWLFFRKQGAAFGCLPKKLTGAAPFA